MIALDTSVAVATFGAWHELHEVARAALTTDSRLTAHTALETYSVSRACLSLSVRIR